MASVTGSRLAFFASGQPVNVVLTATGGTDLKGNPVTGDTVAGAFNLEVFTSVAGSIAPGFQGSAFISGAVPGAVANEVQAGSDTTQSPFTPEQVLQGSVQMLDEFGPENIQIIGSGTNPDSVTVNGAAGDTITGSPNANVTQLIDASDTNLSVLVHGPETITGGAGQTTVWAASGDSITGGSGAITVAGNKGNNMTITGGAGDLDTFNFGSGNSISGATGGSSTTIIDDSYQNANEGHNTIFGGAGNTTIFAGASDLIAARGGNTLINTIPISGIAGHDTVVGGSGHDTVWGGTNDSIVGGSGTANVVAGTADTIVGGSGATTITGNTGDSITGGAGNVLYSNGSGSSFTGGAGNVQAVNLGTNNTVSGSTNAAGNTFIDDSYTNPTSPGSFTGGTNTLLGGAGNATILGGPGDSIVAGTGSLQAWIKDDLPTTAGSGDTIDLTAAARGAAGVRDISVTGGTGTDATVTGFNTSTDVIESQQSVVSGGGTGPGALVVGASATSDGSGNTIITFVDGSTMKVLGVAPTAIHFTQ